MNHGHKNKALLIGLAVILLAGGFLLFKDKGEDVEIEENSSEVRSGEIEVLGEIACLTYATSIADQECVKGLRGDDGKMYALNTTEVERMDEGTKVRAVGVFTPADKSVDDSSVFSYDGVLDARVLKRR